MYNLYFWTVNIRQDLPKDQNLDHTQNIYTKWNTSNDPGKRSIARITMIHMVNCKITRNTGELKWIAMKNIKI